MSAPLTPCPACARHVREHTCPFCGAEVPPAAARPRFVGPVTRAAIFSVAVAGCWTGAVAEPTTTTTTPTETTTPPTDTEPLAIHGGIDGMVVDAQNGQPVAGAQVSLDGNHITATDNRGHYKFRGVPPGTHTIQVSTQGNRNRGGGAEVTATVVVQTGLVRADLQIDLPAPGFDPNNIPKPYGAPPARRRLV